MIDSFGFPQIHHCNFFLLYFRLVGTRSSHSKNTVVGTFSVVTALCSAVQILHDRANPVLSLMLEGNTDTILSRVHGECGTTVLSLAHQGETLPPLSTQEVPQTSTILPTLVPSQFVPQNGQSFIPR